MHLLEHAELIGYLQRSKKKGNLLMLCLMKEHLQNQ
jgi:hypothetical protein